VSYGPLWSSFAAADAITAMRYRVADAEQAKQTGGMVALYPRQDVAEAMAVEGGEPVEDLHLTMCYLGEDVTDLPAQSVVGGIAALADVFTTAITGRVLGHAVFNPDGGLNGEQEPCLVYLISDTRELTPLRAAVHEVCQRAIPNLHEQHEPFFAHVTATYGTVQHLTYTGPVIFDRLSVDWAGEHFDFPLL
jgi:2'-5' RNA ligase